MYISERGEAERLVVEDPAQRKKIITTVMVHHFDMNRTNDMVASKYFWPGLNTKLHCYMSTVNNGAA